MATNATLMNERTARHGIENHGRGRGGPATAVSQGIAAPTKQVRRPRSTFRSRSHGLIPCQIGGRTWYLADRPYQEDARVDIRSRLRSGLVVLSFVIGLLFLLMFAGDLVAGWPFHRHSVAMDVSYVFCGAALIYLGWDTSRDLH